MPAYLPYVQLPLSRNVIARAEEQIGFSLPRAYLALLEVQNGGFIRYCLPDQVHDKIAGLGPHFPSLIDFDWDDYRDTVSFPLDGLVPFDGDGHWHICLDYRKSPEPAVALIDIELDSESRIADSFDAYLARLVLDVSDKWVFKAGDSISDAAAELARISNVEFEATGDWGQGYPVYRARIGGKNSTAWLWLSPNIVPRGFVRTEDKRYQELRDRLPGNAARFPELPAGSYILECSEDALAVAQDLCARAKLVQLKHYISGS